MFVFFLVLYIVSTSQSTSAQPTPKPKCMGLNVNETSCKLLLFFDRPQTVQCVPQERLGEQDIKVLGRPYCFKKMCIVPCEYAKRKRIIGSVHDECSCQQQQQQQQKDNIRVDTLDEAVSSEEKGPSVLKECSSKGDLYKAWCPNGKSSLSFCLDNSNNTQEIFGFRCTKKGMPYCDLSCNAATFFKGSLFIERKNCYCYTSHAVEDGIHGKVSLILINFSILFVFITVFVFEPNFFV